MPSGVYPAPGHRAGNFGTVWYAGRSGYSWSSTIPTGSTDASHLSFSCDIFLARQARLECPAAPLPPGIGRGRSEALEKPSPPAFPLRNQLRPAGARAVGTLLRLIGPVAHPPRRKAPGRRGRQPFRLQVAKHAFPRHKPRSLIARVAATPRGGPVPLGTRKLEFAQNGSVGGDPFLNPKRLYRAPPCTRAADSGKPLGQRLPVKHPKGAPPRGMAAARPLAGGISQPLLSYFARAQAARPRVPAAGNRLP